MPTIMASNNRSAARERPRLNPIVAEAERQWLFTEQELLQSPSVLDGMAADEEKTFRRKGVNFILQVGMMLKLPQTTLSTAAVFFNRYLMRQSLVAKSGHPRPLHHYQVAATSLFLATKVEENCRKMKELVVACVRVALKDPNKLVDEQTKDFWKWRDTILYSEDVLLENICFDLSVEPPYKIMYEMLKYLGVEHNKKLRNASWAFLSDSCLTQLCLLFTSRTIAAASLFAGAKMCEISFPDEDGTPWWEIQHVTLKDIRRACNHMAEIYESAPAKDGGESIYVGLRTPEDEDPRLAKTRLRTEQTPLSPAASSVAMERSASDQSTKRKRDELEKSSTNGAPAPARNDEKTNEEKAQNGHPPNGVEGESEGREAKRVKVNENGVPAPVPSTTNGAPKQDEKQDEDVSEEGEVEE